MPNLTLPPTNRVPSQALQGAVVRWLLLGPGGSRQGSFSLYSTPPHPQRPLACIWSYRTHGSLLTKVQ